MNSFRFVRWGVAAACLFAGTQLLQSQTLSVTTGLQLWLRGDAGITTNAGGGVIQWADQSGNANNATQLNDPEAPAFIGNALNAKPVLRFDGADDYLEVGDVDGLSIVGDLSTFFVVRFDDFATYRAVWGKTAANYPAATDIYTLPASGVLRGLRGDGGNLNLSSVDTAQPLRAATYLVLGVQVAGDTMSHYLNNQDNGSGTATTLTADGNRPLRIGTRDDLFTRLKGDLAELLIYDRALSSLERSNVFFYLQTRYNLLNLPPAITLASDPAGPNVTVGSVVTLNATPVDLDGTIARVEFLSGGVLVGTATQAPYSVRVQIDSAGTAQFTARAVDNRDASATSAPLNLTASPAGPVDLTVLTGLQLWLRADAGTVLGGSGGVVQWADQSANLNHAGQLDENSAPTLTNGAINGYPALRFDGVNDFLEIPDSDSLSIAGDITSFFVVKFTDFSTFRAVWAKTAGNLPAPTDMYALPNNGRLRLYRGNGTGPGSQPVDSARPYTAGSFLLSGFQIAGPSVSHYLSGLPNGTGTMTIAPADGNGTLRIGTRADAVTRMRGEMAELVIYDRALGAAERRAVERYLAEKYGLSALVVVTNAPPTVAVTSPAGEVLQAPGMTTVTVAASDADGSVASVQIFADGVLLGTDTSAPYTATLTVSYGGLVTITATATDNLGGVSSAAPVRVCVQGPGRPAGLVGYWPLDGNAVAVVGTSGIMVSNPVPAMDRNGMPGGALAFDGTLQQRVEIPGGGGLNAAAQASISMWVRWDGLQDTGFGGAAGAVLARQQDNVFSAAILNLSTSDPNSASVQWRHNTAGGVTINSGSLAFNQSWRHIALTFNSSASQLYLDGILEGLGTGGTLPINATTPLSIGAWAGGGGSFSTSSIDDVAVWNRVLTADEVGLLAGRVRTPLDLLVQPDCLTMERSALDVTLRWGSGAALQSATEVAGPYADVTPTPVSPFTTGAAGAAKYFRLRSP